MTTELLDMQRLKQYACGICGTTPDQISHHKSHLVTDKHTTKRELFKMQLEIMTPDARIAQYNTDDAGVILEGIETITTDYILEDSSSEKGNKKLKSRKPGTKDNKNNKEKVLKDNLQTEIKTIMAGFTKDEEQKMIEEAIKVNNHLMDISNRDALRDKIHEIHNFLRNNGAGYGMNALKVFNLLYGLKRIEQANDKYMENNNILEGQPNLYNKLELDEKICSFTEILKLANDASTKEHGDEELFHILDDDILTAISKSKIKTLLFYEIPKNIKAIIYVQLIQLINEVSQIETKYEVQLSGNIYEYFIGRDESAISELGAYFTNRYIINFIMDKLQPKLKADGTIPEMIDMFGGSGGFTTGYIDYIIKNNKDVKIDWTKELAKVHHYDMNEDVIKSAGLEMFLLTDEIPTSIDNFNSFKSEFGNKKFELIITNPPYGGDKVKKTICQENQEIKKEFIKEQLPLTTDNQIKATLNIQLKEIIKEEEKQKKIVESLRVSLNPKVCSKRTIAYAYNHGELKATDKEAVSLLMLMDMVAENGTVAGVLKEGVFFDKTYKDIRRVLIENFNVREVISVPSDQFENTSTKTSIIIFDNLADKKTSTVKFSEIIVEKYENNKLDIVNGYARLLEKKGNIKGLVSREISTATREEILENPICSLNGKDYNKKVIVPGDGFKLVKLGEIVEFLAKSKRKAGEGKETGKYNFYTSSDKVLKCDIADYNQEALIVGNGGVANIKFDNLFSCSDHNYVITSKYNKYLYHFLQSNIDILNKEFTGSTLKNLSITNFNKINIPIPNTDQSIQQWVDKISKPFDEKNTKAKRIKELEEQVQTRIKEITENEDCDEVELGSVCEIKTGKLLSKNDAITGDFNVYGGGGVSFTHNTFNCQGFNILISRVGTNNVLIINEKFYLTDNGYVLEYKNELYRKFISYYIFNNKDIISNIGNGSNQKVISKSKLSLVKIPIPKDKSLITALESTFQEIEKLQDEVKQAETLYKQYLDELGTSAIKKDSSAQSSTPDPTHSTQPLPLEPTINTESKPSTPAKKAVKIIKRKSPTSKSSKSSKSSGGSGVSLDDILG